MMKKVPMMHCGLQKHAFLLQLGLILRFAALVSVIPFLVWFSILPEWYPWKVYLKSLPLMVLLLYPSFLLGRLGKYWLYIVYIVCVTIASLVAVHLMIQGCLPTAETLYAIMETSHTEAMEFYATYGEWRIFFVVSLAFFVPLIFLIPLQRMPSDQNFKSEKWSFSLFFLLLIISPALVDDTLPKKLATSWCEYRELKFSLDNFARKEEAWNIPEVRDMFPSFPRIIVVVIGESATRHHMGLYGYHRATTPRFEAIRDELIIFSDIISPFGSTAANQIAMLSMTGKNGSSFSALRFFQKAGFKTTWITTQNTFYLGTGLANLVYAADRVIPLNSEIYKVSQPYDDKILPVVDAQLKEISPSNKRHLIFINIMGSHLKYSSRYPKEFAQYTGTADIESFPWRDDQAKHVINTYDNSIVYTDFLLGELVEKLRPLPGAALVYFSDHGQEVYDTLKHSGHGGSLASRYYVDIPFILWLSPSFLQMRPDAARWKEYTDRPGLHDCLPSILAELCGLAFDDPHRASNILSPDFTPASRQSLGGRYDEKFSGRRGINERDIVQP